jgi:hypothetical protein
MDSSVTARRRNAVVRRSAAPRIGQSFVRRHQEQGAMASAVPPSPSQDVTDLVRQVLTRRA